MIAISCLRRLAWSSTILVVVACSGGTGSSVFEDDMVSPGETIGLDDSESVSADADDQLPEEDSTSGVGDVGNVPMVDGGGTCPYESRENQGLAYRYGVPSGWLAYEEGGTLLIASDESASTAAIIYTALLRSNDDPAWFLGSYASAVSQGFAANGGGFEFDSPNYSGQGATVDFYGFVSGRQVAGEARATVEGGFATARMYWSDVSSWSEDRQVLTTVVDCFQRIIVLDDARLNAATLAAATPPTEPVATSNPWGPLVPKYEGGFSYQAPASWNSTGSQGDGVTAAVATAPADDAAAVFVFMLTRFQPTEDQLISTLFASYGINAGFQPSAESLPGASLYEFSGVIGGQNGRGMVAIRKETYMTFFAFYVSMAMSTVESWDLVKSTVAQIASTGTVTDASSNLSQLPAMPNLSVENVFGNSVTQSASYRSAVEEQASQNWSEAMRGYVTVESPSTGDRWDVPLNSYNPAGGGFYRSLPGGGSEQLIVR